MAVSQFGLKFGERDKTSQNQQLLDWYRYAPKPTKKESKVYYMPYDTGGLTRLGQLRRLKNHKICLNALLSLLGVGKGTWETITKHSKTSMVIPPHGNFGKPNRKRKADDPVVVDLKSHFNRLMEDAEVEATRFVREETGEITERDANEETRYLPTALGKRSCYT